MMGGLGGLWHLSAMEEQQRRQAEYYNLMQQYAGLASVSTNPESSRPEITFRNNQQLLLLEE